MNTPVVLIIFNRPDTALQVFEVIRSIKPKTLLVIADGPRKHVDSDEEKCRQSRELVENIDWPCEVLKNYSTINLGCKKRISSGLTWVFEQVEEAIILEDDCLPDPSFFPFCEELLAKYRYDTRIMTISGNNFQDGKSRNKDSYYFSHYNHCWGWASWRRAWQHFDIEMKSWPQLQREGWLQDMLMYQDEAKRWENTFQRVFEDHIDTWDYIWTYSCWVQSGLSILPNINLVSNIGDSGDGTHMNSPGNILFRIPVSPVQFPLKHPKFVVRNLQADRETFKLMFSNHIFDRIRRRYGSFVKTRNLRLGNF